MQSHNRRSLHLAAKWGMFGLIHVGSFVGMSSTSLIIYCPYLCVRKGPATPPAGAELHLWPSWQNTLLQQPAACSSML